MAHPTIILFVFHTSCKIVSAFYVTHGHLLTTNKLYTDVNHPLKGCFNSWTSNINGEGGSQVRSADITAWLAKYGAYRGICGKRLGK